VKHSVSEQMAPARASAATSVSPGSIPQVGMCTEHPKGSDTMKTRSDPPPPPTYEMAPPGAITPAASASVPRRAKLGYWDRR